MAVTIEFFFDISSPYSYLAATQIDRLGQRAGAPVRWRPFLLGGVFKSTGNQPPAVLPARVPYLLEDLKRWAAHYGVPFQFPSIFPMNSLHAMRALVTLEDAAVPEAAMGLFTAYWVDNHDLTRPEVLANVLGEEPVVLAMRPEIKQELRQSTEEAIARGAFGAPTIFVGEQMFFGNDRLPFVEAAVRQAMV